MNQIKIIANYFGVSVEDVTGKYRGGITILAREFCYKILKDTTDLSLKAIAFKLNKTEHATVISGIDRVNALIKNEPKIKAHYDEILSRLANSENYLLKEVERLVKFKDLQNDT